MQKNTRTSVTFKDWYNIGKGKYLAFEINFISYARMIVWNVSSVYEKRMLELTICF